jgi:8-oxo-dGTP pyrophosphatase MutT (NUDIX family)
VIFIKQVNRARQLLDDLSAYVPEDGADSRSLERIRELVATASDPFTRDVPHHVTAAAVVARPDGSAFLLVHHRRLGRWLQPGGHVEPEDATVLAAARREAREETGVSALALPCGDLVLDVDVHDIPPSAGRPAHVHYDVRYLFTTAEAEISARLAEVREARWFSPSAMDEVETDESLRRALAKARARLRP